MCQPWIRGDLHLVQHTQTQRYPHTHTHTHIHTHTHKCLCKFMCTHSHTQKNTKIHTHDTFVLTETDTHTFRPTHTHPCSMWGLQQTAQTPQTRCSFELWAECPGLVVRAVSPSGGRLSPSLRSSSDS